MGEFADDGAGADDGDFDGDVVEAAGFEDGEGVHLGAGLDLEGADGVGAAHEVVGGGVVFGDLGDVDWFAALFAKADGVFHGGEHAEAEEVDFDDAEVFAVVFVPLHDGAVGHGGGLDGDDVVESVVADDDAAGVLAEVAGEAEELVEEVGEGFEAGVAFGDAGFGDEGVVLRFFFVAAVGDFFGGVAGAGGGVDVGEAVGGFFGEAEDFADFAKGGSGAVGDDVGGHGGAAAAVFFEDVLDDGFAAVAGGEVDVDVGPGFAVFGEEAFEEEAAADGVDGGEAEEVADDGVGGGAAALAEDVLGVGEADDVVDDEEVAGEAELADEGEFLFELGGDFFAGVFAVAVGDALVGELLLEGCGRHRGLRGVRDGGRGSGSRGFRG